MSKPFQLLVFFLLILILPVSVYAQNYFVEGRADYSIYLKTGESSGPSGTYSIIIKGGMVRKEISMNNGFKNVLIYDNLANSAVSLQADQKYAVQVDFNEFKQKLKQYEGFTLTELPETSTIAGLPCNKAKLVYKDGSTSDIWYARQWTLKEPAVFDRFPGIKYFPVSFEYKNDEGTVMSFRADKIEAGPVESALFRIPPEYKIMSQKEYRQLSK